MSGVITDVPQVPEGHQIPQEWFDERLRNYSSKSKVLESVYAEEIAAFQAFCSNQTSPDEAAQAITRPISNTCVPDLGGYAPEIVALCQLLELLIDALIEWPSSRTPDLIALLTAISNIPDNLHQGEALDDDDNVLTWSGPPYINMVWSDANWMTPHIIVKECSKHSNSDAALQHACDKYIKAQDVEAQLVAVGLGPFGMKRAFYYLIYALEWHLNPKDKAEAQKKESRAREPFEPRFHIPAVTCWIKHTGQKLYQRDLQFLRCGMENSGYTGNWPGNGTVK